MKEVEEVWTAIFTQDHEYHLVEFTDQVTQGIARLLEFEEEDGKPVHKVETQLCISDGDNVRLHSVLVTFTRYKQQNSLTPITT